MEVSLYQELCGSRPRRKAPTPSIDSKDTGKAALGISAEGSGRGRLMCVGCSMRESAHMAPGVDSLASVKYARKVIPSAIALAKGVSKPNGTGR